MSEEGLQVIRVEILQHRVLADNNAIITGSQARITETWSLHFLFRPLVHVIEEFPRLVRCGLRRWDRNHLAAAFDDFGKNREASFAVILKEFGNIDEFDWVAQVWLVRAIFRHRFGIRNPRKRSFRKLAAFALPISEFFKHAMHDRFD